jgi:hypothetical protein
MIKILTILLFLFAVVVVVRTELTLERIDAIADLSDIAKKFFSEEPNLKYEEPDAKMMNAFAWSISEMWDDKESALYVLTRLAKLVDEKDANGELTVPARVIRSFAENSEARKVYITTAESSGAAMITSSSYDTETKEEEEIERLYMTGNEDEANIKVSKLIEKRWNSVENTLEDIEMAAKNGQFNLMSALIKQGANRDTLKFMAPELKASLIIKLLSLPSAQIQPSTAKWLLTMDTYREDQLKLVKTIEKALKKRSGTGKEKAMQTIKNNLLEVFGEVESIESRKRASELKSDYFNGIASIDVETLSKPFYKNTNPPRTLKNQKLTKNLKQNKLEKAVKVVETKEENKSIEQAEKAEKTEQAEQTEQKIKPEQTEASKEKTEHERNYFDQKEEREREIDKAIYEANDDPLYDNDGVYDDNEKKTDRVAQIIVIAIIASIIATAIGTYVYLRARRARRNRTMLVVTEALETVA